ncbi:hypothetical protein SS50377_22461 [Spironucleus salmonicida]|uniref:Uncharacterized protein n=1 Tax=Spironucleus salmonicida TaxID=348837 RepID=V6LCR9_9EUKA|nr:hypothetical protein SS50377_22461 [Spironucleus salmonicida]|eukprot:EST42048.1 Hypothetical protein SS50377_18355 [Spironucleus salmonicida]
MPPMTFQKQQIQIFEANFLQIISLITEVNIAQVKDAYFIFRDLDESKRHGIWESISKAVGAPRDRIYKFFRFTWSKQFYRSLDEVRPKLKQDILEQLKYTKQREGAHQRVWKIIWNKWKDEGLHYEATDQFCRNTVNFWFKEAPKITSKFEETFNKFGIVKSQEAEFVSMRNNSIVEPQSESIESDSFEDDMVIGIRRKRVQKRVRQVYNEEIREFDLGDLDEWPNDFCGFE